MTRIRHSWNLTPKAAMRLQARLAGQIVECSLQRMPRLVAGGDLAFFDKGKRLVAAWVVWDRETEDTVDESIEVRDVPFPYVPGLLSFREAPALLAAARRLRTRPDAFMFDGHGLAHPRRFGLACHAGLWLDRPSLGCAKSLLCGTHAEPGEKAGASRRLLFDGKVVGRAVRTRDRVKPVYISIGHRINLADAVKLALRCCRGYRIPEPTRLAHNRVTALRKSQEV